jgi:hypothetical protein
MGWEDNLEPWKMAGLERAEVHNHVLSPAEADVRITLCFAEPVLDLELRGRLVGPRCPYASTVEVAYPLRPLPGDRPDTLCARVVIPEPSLWEPACPFLYEGPVEVWQADYLVHRLRLRHGLRSLQLGPRGLRWNGQPLLIRGVNRETASQEQTIRLRAAGYNTFLLAQPDDYLATADRLGLLALVRTEVVPLVQPDAACFLGWIVPQEVLERKAAVVPLTRQPTCLLGVELTRPLPEEQLAGVSFLCCSEELLPELESLRQPKLVLTKREFPSEPPGPGILGRVRL